MKPCKWLDRELHGRNDCAPCNYPLNLGNPKLPKSVTKYYAFEWPLPRAWVTDESCKSCPCRVPPDEA